METNPKKQRQHFYRDYTSGQWSMSELCGRYQISRPTGCKWIDRIETEGLKAVEPLDLSLSDEEILAQTEATYKEAPDFQPMQSWKEALARRLTEKWGE